MIVAVVFDVTLPMIVNKVITENKNDDENKNDQNATSGCRIYSAQYGIDEAGSIYIFELLTNDIEINADATSISGSGDDCIIMMYATPQEDGYPVAKEYPVIALENGIQGRVICQFTVWKDGSIRDIVVLRGVDKSLDKEAIRLIESMPKWKPAKQRGKAVACKYTVPVSFRLQ